MNEEMMKSLVALIDESLAEIEELKKSDRFSASEVKLDGPGAGIAGKDSNGSMGKKDDEEDEEDDEDEDEEDDDDKEMDKGEGKNREADPNGGHHQVAKEETGMPAGTTAKAEGTNRQADPNGGHHQVAKSVEQAADLKKSMEEQNTLLKAYVDERFSSIEGKLESIVNLVKEVANSPVPARSVSYKGITPLKKSDGEEAQPLTKSTVVEKLFELKKSGTYVNSTDIASAELASPAELVKIATKYNIN